MRLFYRFSAAASLVAIGSLVGWANWEAPAMHHFVRPVEVVVWQLTPLVNGAAAAPALQGRLAAEPGVSACAVSPRTNCVALVYHPEATTPEALYRAVGRCGGHVIANPPAPATTAALRQCPVPAGYLTFLDQLRFTFNVRRFFVTT